MSKIQQTFALTSPWPGTDPFLFAAHHLDDYPEGNHDLTVDAPLTGRDIGQDFSGKDGWSMYHGDSVPGFPAHPHRGFETVTVVEEGLIDHTDSAGAEARYGQGDTQWLTAGAGVSHCEMFPMVHSDARNPQHLFQIWLNLAPEDKSAPADFSMFWAEDTPIVEQSDDAGRTARVKVVAGAFGDTQPLAPPSNSWAARPDSHVAIWHADLEPGATVSLPAADPSAVRTIYLYDGTADIDGQELTNAGAVVSVDTEVQVTAGAQRVRFLVLQGRPIGAPVVQHGPFVGNSRDDIIRAFTEYQQGQFGQWTLPRTDPVHPREQGRFARYPDGTVRAPKG